MTEVDAVIPEIVALPVQSSTNSSESRELTTGGAATNNGILENKDQLNGGDKNKKPVVLEAMEVDAPDTEEDDSQITSSTENGGTGGGNDSKISGEEENTANRRSSITSTENSKESLNEAIAVTVSIKDKLKNLPSVPSPKSNPSSSTEDSSSDSLENKSESHEDVKKSVAKLSIPVANIVEPKHCNVRGTDELEKPATDTLIDDVTNANTESNPHMSSDAKTNSLLVAEDDDEDDNMSFEAKDEKSTDVPADDRSETMDTADDPLHAAEDLTEKVENKTIRKENGSASEMEKANDDAGGIVDLDDDSDDEEIPESPVPKKQARRNHTSNVSSVSAVDLSVASKAKSVCSDSDGAVVIGSDSENDESNQPPAFKPEKVESPQEIVDEDDDDDCVVIEDDDTPAPPTNADLTKRKNLALDSATNSDDSQPPIKRQRTSVPPSTVSQITIKDARSLMPQEVPAVRETNDAGAVIYPVNIRTATSSAPGPPKLVPVSNTGNSSSITSVSGLSSNANLLPGLTDDMFVLEAPSFIVPYIYEKPPADNLRIVVRDIEAKYELSKDDLADADKSDEFDMMTEQNKVEREAKEGGKKKKRRGEEEPDESWSEESDEDDDEEDDDDSETGVRTKVLIKEANDDLTALKGAIKPAAAVAAVVAPVVAGVPNAINAPIKTGPENYFESPLGKFFMDIGVGLVQEFVQSDLIRLQKRKMRKSIGTNMGDFELAIAALSGNLEASKKKNSPFKFTMKRCEFCNFKSESSLSMANHYETPHMNGPLYKCNFCIFEIRNANEIVYHMEAVHNIKARLVKPLPYHQCPNCGFEDNGKAKLGRHQPVCAKKFRPELNLAPPHDWEAPAKIPRIKPRHGLVGTATAYQAMAAQAAQQKAALASIQQQQQQAAQARSLHAAALAAQNAANKIRGRPPTMASKGPNASSPVGRGSNQVRSPMATNVVMPNNYQLAGAQLIQNANALAKKTLSGQPSISITPLPRQSASSFMPQSSTSPSSSKMPPAGMKPGQSPSGNKAQFVICEICDGYIKDLEQLRNHMQWMHKVKIHPKMIYNRPPLNCQKCQFRFFTDQGLERHLLGSHGLVTSSMQEAANKGKDAGRCPVCGRLYQWKLLNHVSRDHHMTLKPAHLSYKCTVCTATFGMYKQFETHVYTAHSTVAKKAMDGKKNNAASSGGAAASGSQRSGLSATNDSLLKPLKINDEITIIPQPASKPRITNMESHVID